MHFQIILVCFPSICACGGTRRRKLYRRIGFSRNMIFDQEYFPVMQTRTISMTLNSLHLDVVQCMYCHITYPYSHITCLNDTLVASAHENAVSCPSILR
jgi:hypothetical protein